jgi:hypothetical protein
MYNHDGYLNYANQQWVVVVLKPDNTKGPIGTGTQTVGNLSLWGFVVHLPRNKPKNPINRCDLQQLWFHSIVTVGFV